MALLPGLGFSLEVTSDFRISLRLVLSCLVWDLGFSSGFRV